MDIAEEVWTKVRREIAGEAVREPAMRKFFDAQVLRHETLGAALIHVLALKIGEPETLVPGSLAALMEGFFLGEKGILAVVAQDLAAARARDPACTQLNQPLLYFKGFQALQSHRFAHWLWNTDRNHMARWMQSRCSEVFAVDIHPAAKIGAGIFIDHATGIVIGETTVIGDNVSILHGVTLGGSGKETGNRHPKIGDGVLLSAGCAILGNISVGDGAKVAACSVVLQDVPSRATVAGIPARIVGRDASVEMDQRLRILNEIHQ